MMMDSGHGGGSLDFDLNLAPIIDCFTVLIAFILVSASYLSIGVLDAGMMAGGETTTQEKTPELSIQIELKPGHELFLKLEGKQKSEQKLAAISGEWDFTNLSTQLQALKAKWSDQHPVTLVASNEIEYREVIRAMDEIRKTFPVVLLGGF